MFRDTLKRMLKIEAGYLGMTLYTVQRLIRSTSHFNLPKDLEFFCLLKLPSLEYSN